MYCVLGAELLVYLIKSIRELVACCVLCVGGRALGVSEQDFFKGRWPAVFCVVGANNLMYLTKIIQRPMACYVLCDGGRALGVSEQDFSRAGGLLYTVCWGQSPWCI